MICWTAGAGDVHVLSAFQQLDVNTDHRLALQEIAVLSSLLQRIDNDGDGILSQAELFSDEADADWINAQIMRIQNGGRLPEPKPVPEPEQFIRTVPDFESEPEPQLGPLQQAEHPGSSTEGTALSSGESETAEQGDAAFIDGLSELTMVMDKAGSLGTLLNQHASSDDGDGSQPGRGRAVGNARSEQGLGVGSLIGNRDDSEGGSTRQQLEQGVEHNVDLEDTLALEEELRRVRGLQ